MEGEDCGLTIRREASGISSRSTGSTKVAGVTGVEKQGVIPGWCVKRCSNYLWDKTLGSFRKVVLCQKPIK